MHELQTVKPRDSVLGQSQIYALDLLISRYLGPSSINFRSPLCIEAKSREQLDLETRCGTLIEALNIYISFI